MSSQDTVQWEEVIISEPQGAPSLDAATQDGQGDKDLSLPPKSSPTPEPPTSHPQTEPMEQGDPADMQQDGQEAQRQQSDVCMSPITKTSASPKPEDGAEVGRSQSVATSGGKAEEKSVKPPLSPVSKEASLELDYGGEEQQDAPEVEQPPAQAGRKRHRARSSSKSTSSSSSLSRSTSSSSSSSSQSSSSSGSSQAAARRRERRRGRKRSRSRRRRHKASRSRSRSRSRPSNIVRDPPPGFMVAKGISKYEVLEVQRMAQHAMQNIAKLEKAARLAREAKSHPESPISGRDWRTKARQKGSESPVRKVHKRKRSVSRGSRSPGRRSPGRRDRERRKAKGGQEEGSKKRKKDKEERKKEKSRHSHRERGDKDKDAQPRPKDGSPGRRTQKAAVEAQKQADSRTDKVKLPSLKNNKSVKQVLPGVDGKEGDKDPGQSLKGGLAEKTSKAATRGGTSEHLGRGRADAKDDEPKVAAQRQVETRRQYSSTTDSSLVLPKPISMQDVDEAERKVSRRGGPDKRESSSKGVTDSERVLGIASEKQQVLASPEQKLVGDKADQQKVAAKVQKDEGRKEGGGQKAQHKKPEVKNSTQGAPALQGVKQGQAQDRSLTQPKQRSPLPKSRSPSKVIDLPDTSLPPPPKAAPSSLSAPHTDTLSSFADLPPPPPPSIAAATQLPGPPAQLQDFSHFPPPPKVSPPTQQGAIDAPPAPQSEQEVRKDDRELASKQTRGAREKAADEQGKVKVRKKSRSRSKSADRKLRRRSRSKGRSRSRSRSGGRRRSKSRSRSREHGKARKRRSRSRSRDRRQRRSRSRSRSRSRNRHRSQSDSRYRRSDPSRRHDKPPSRPTKRTEPDPTAAQIVASVLNTSRQAAPAPTQPVKESAAAAQPLPQPPFGQVPLPPPTADGNFSAYMLAPSEDRDREPSGLRATPPPDEGGRGGRGVQRGSEQVADQVPKAPLVHSSEAGPSGDRQGGDAQGEGEVDDMRDLIPPPILSGKHTKPSQQQGTPSPTFSPHRNEELHRLAAARGRSPTPKDEVAPVRVVTMGSAKDEKPPRRDSHRRDKRRHR